MAFSLDGDFIKNFPLPDGIIPQGLELINYDLDAGYYEYNKNQKRAS